MTVRATEAGLRILIAYDLSADAERAVDVIARGSWPTGTIARVVTSTTGIGSGISSFAGPREMRAHARAVRDSVAEAQAAAAARLQGAGLLAEPAIVAGQPGAAVVSQARGLGADLVVAGARAQSRVAATLVGSVSAEISERAPCSVLVVRVESCSRVLLATDGSAGAEAATEVVARWPLFGGADIRAVAVATPKLMDAYGVELDEDRAAAHSAVEAAVQHLAEGGRPASGRVRVGAPADEIAMAAREWPADVVVTGSTGKPRLQRLLLGSVARSVLEGVQASVLIVRSRRAGRRRRAP